MQYITVASVVQTHVPWRSKKRAIAVGIKKSFTINTEWSWVRNTLTEGYSSK